MLERIVPVDRPAPRAISAERAATERIGRLAIRSLYREAALTPKPGLVSPGSRGSHRDMDFSTFLRSLQSLRPYFPAIAACGLQRPGFARLRGLGIEAEADMLAATGSVNTHRGAIFNLGLLCAAAGCLIAHGETPSAETACAAVKINWAADILDGLAVLPAASQLSHGLEVARRYGTGGARQEAASGFPAALEIGLPAYRSTLAATGDGELAAVQALFALIAELDDTNLLWRGGPAGLAYGRRAASGFLAAGGVLADDWRDHASAIDRDFVARDLSPGGSADLLGVTLFLAEVDGAV
ncbi:MAG: triphosphoribosyl-dephospho-CoA synthase MdcB [Betaproteobacteria bacterium HGW-Betaproteobacteria-6]|jgi:triphosphoribosyl-dephospho-CoA synthase|nr:MAG: triphosphoribosyl-dephospho-CoA synthase MdcB [Betaproteobacteria bacterium HGW-Betaproteobacteria-6]